MIFRDMPLLISIVTTSRTAGSELIFQYLLHRCNAIIIIIRFFAVKFVCIFLSSKRMRNLAKTMNWHLYKSADCFRSFKYLLIIHDENSKEIDLHKL